MSAATQQSLDVAALLPGVGVFGGVRRFLEIGNELVDRGHRYVIYHPEGTPPEWLPFRGEVRPLAALSDARHQLLISNDPTYLREFEAARAHLKFFYFALENIPRERAIVNNPGWKLLANSSGMAAYLFKRYRVRAEKVIGGINLDVFRPSADDGAPRGGYRILTFGRTSRGKKGVPLVVRAVESFARRLPSPDVTLVLFDHVGQGNEQDPREGFRCQIPFEFHVNLSQPELAKLYASCDIFVSAEKRAGWANTVAEAMACGVPVVCTRSGTRDLARHGETAWVARWRHARLLRQGLQEVHEDPRLARTLRDAALEHVRQYSWKHVADQLEAVVHRALAT